MAEEAARWKLRKHLGQTDGRRRVREEGMRTPDAFGGGSCGGSSSAAGESFPPAVG